MGTPTSSPPGVVLGQQVRIAVPGLERASATVTHATDAWLSLRLNGFGGPRAKDLHGARGAVEFMDDSGIHRLRGVVELADDPSPTAVRFVLRNGSGTQFLGRREHIRTVLRAPAVVTDVRSGQQYKGRSLNVSEGGMMVGDLDGTLPGPGSKVRFAVAPRDCRDPIFGSAVVLRADNHRGNLALQFEHMPREAVNELARVVYEHEQNSRGGSAGKRERRARGGRRR